MIGSTVGTYRITKLLGEGGMGAVYQATDNIEREVAIKALRPQLIHDAERLKRFRSEAMALGRLHHPNITSLFHLLEENDTFYLVMEFVEGQTLEELIYQNGALPPRLALDLLIDALPGFEHAHARGVIHRDIKASNLMVSTEGATKIMDFGIARIDGAARLTQTGKQIGTLEYMSPEQVRGLEQDARSDIYSLGVLLFELLTGRVPFTAESDFELMRAHLEKTPPSVRFLVPSLPPALDEILVRALTKEPQARFENVAEFRESLEAIASELSATPLSPALVTTPGSQASRSTSLKTPGGRYDTLPLEDRYGTRIQGTPLPADSPAVLPLPPSAPSVAQTAFPVAPIPQLPLPKSVANPWLFPALGVGGVVLFVISILSWGMLHPAPPKQNTPSRAPVSRTFVSPKERATQAERGTVTKQPASRVRVRQSRQRLRTTRKPKPRRIVREVIQKRSLRTASTQPAGHTQSRQQFRRSAASGGEEAMLRAIIKGH